MNSSVRTPMVMFQLPGKGKVMPSLWKCAGPARNIFTAMDAVPRAGCDRVTVTSSTSGCAVVVPLR